MTRYLLQWMDQRTSYAGNVSNPMDQLRWQRLKPMEKLADMLVKRKR
jgi:hypothetical protein